MLVVRMNGLLSLRRSISCPFLPSDADHSLFDNVECLNFRLPCRMSSRDHPTLTRVNESFIYLARDHLRFFHLQTQATAFWILFFIGIFRRDDLDLLVSVLSLFHNG